MSFNAVLTDQAIGLAENLSTNIATTNRKPAIAFFGEVPWHRLGQKLDAPATAEEAIKAAGLDYEVVLKSVITSDWSAVPKARAVVRSDDKTVLGVVSHHYRPVQNREAFNFLDAVVADGGLRYHTAGALGKGERVWMLAKLPSHIRVKNTDDLVEKFLLLSNAHDGTSALRVFFTPIRVVCQNTLNLAERRGRDQGVSIAHRGDLQAKVREAQRVLGLAETFYREAAVKIDVLASYYPTVDQLKAFFEDLYPDPLIGERGRSRNIRENLMRLFENGVGLDMPGVKRTAWAAYNAVTEWVDHHRPTRAPSPSGRSLKRLESAWFGGGRILKAKAWNLALNLAA